MAFQMLRFSNLGIKIKRKIEYLTLQYDNLHIFNQSGNGKKISDFIDGTYFVPLRNAFLKFLSGAFYITFFLSLLQNFSDVAS